MNNVRKHASASKVVLSLEFPRADFVRVTIRDDGQGYDMQTAKPGFGTLCMLDYCDALEGTLVLESKARRGTTVTATFPIGTDQQATSDKGPSKPGRLKTA